MKIHLESFPHGQVDTPREAILPVDIDIRMNLDD